MTHALDAHVHPQHGCLSMASAQFHVTRCVRKICCAAEAFHNPDTSLGNGFVAKPEWVSNNDVAKVISQVTGTDFAYYFMPDDKARALPFPGAVAMSNMFEFWRTCESALQKLCTLPTLGQQHPVQQFVEENKEAFQDMFKNAKHVG